MPPVSLEDLGRYINAGSSPLAQAVADDIFRRGVAVEKPTPASSHYPEISEELRSIAHAIDYSEYPDLAVMIDRVKAVFQVLQGLYDDELFMREQKKAQKPRITAEEHQARVRLAFAQNPVPTGLGGTLAGPSDNVCGNVGGCPAHGTVNFATGSS